MKAIVSRPAQNPTLVYSIKFTLRKVFSELQSAFKIEQPINLPLFFNTAQTMDFHNVICRNDNLILNPRNIIKSLNTNVI